ncbi:MAG: hypothetical protein JSW09_03490 [Pseudomonadota bacterium]|nr:MAG: hypothetical protein JSW09_03490 [Pseudomonadota bacterium]
MTSSKKCWPGRAVWPAILAALLLSGLAACGSDKNDDTPTPPILCTNAPAPTSLTISGYAPTDGTHDGVFDPSLTEDGCERVWMSYSAVRNHSSGLRLVSTRIARGNDSGSGWEDVGVAPNNVTVYELNPAAPISQRRYGAWEQETSRLVYDPYSSDANQRWKILWHRYRFDQATVGSPGSPLFQHSWISYSAAPQATGPWSPERKLFAGSLYDITNNTIVGPPEYNLHTADPALNDCLAFAEPGMLATPNGMYLSLKCASGPNGAGNVILLRCDNQFSAGSCTYRGTILAGSEAPIYNNAFGAGANSFTGFSATDLARIGATDYLLVTPTENDGYRGCFAFEISSLDNATLVRASGVATLRGSVTGTPGSFNGACGHTASNTALGIVYSELVLTANPFFRIFASGQGL